jgi:hypothetical protein
MNAEDINTLTIARRKLLDDYTLLTYPKAQELEQTIPAQLALIEAIHPDYLDPEMPFTVEELVIELASAIARGAK